MTGVQTCALPISVFLSTHSLNVAEELADHLAIIHRGALLAAGTLSDIRAKAGYQEDEDLEQMFLELTSTPAEH